MGCSLNGLFQLLLLPHRLNLRLGQFDLLKLLYLQISRFWVIGYLILVSRLEWTYLLVRIYSQLLQVVLAAFMHGLLVLVNFLVYRYIHMAQTFRVRFVTSLLDLLLEHWIPFELSIDFQLRYSLPLAGSVVDVEQTFWLLPPIPLRSIIVAIAHMMLADDTFHGFL